MACPGAAVDKVTSVVSHPQALEQCADYIRARGYETRACSNTALAAKEVAALDDPTVAAIASEETAALFGLRILERGINDSRNNTTRFAAFSPAANRPASAAAREDENFVLVFTVRNEAGALAQTLDIIGAHGYNLRALRSRP
jgi:chorismate mutase/prephenate dehydratase